MTNEPDGGRSIATTFMDVSRVKQVAGSGVRESWGRRGRRSRGGPRWGGSKRSPRGVGRCCTRCGSARRGRPGPGRLGSLRGTPRSYFRDPKPRSRDPFCPGVRTRVRTWRSSGWVVTGASNRKDRNGPPLPVTIVTTGATLPSSSTSDRSTSGRPSISAASLRASSTALTRVAGVRGR